MVDLDAWAAIKLRGALIVLKLQGSVTFNKRPRAARLQLICIFRFLEESPVVGEQIAGTPVQIAGTAQESPRSAIFCAARATILMWCTRWTAAFTSYIKATLVTRLKEMDTFMDNVRQGLAIVVVAASTAEPSAGTTAAAASSTTTTTDKDALMAVMKSICEVRKAGETFAELCLSMR